MADNCKICNACTGIEFHHVIPRAYGGEHGPQVPLCGKHHNLVHLTALKLKKTKGCWVSVGEVEEVPTTGKELFIRLANSIYVAMNKAEGHELPKKLTMKLSPREISKIESLKPILNMTNRESVMHHALELLFSLHFRETGNRSNPVPAKNRNNPAPRQSSGAKDSK